MQIKNDQSKWFNYYSYFIFGYYTYYILLVIYKIENLFKCDYNVVSTSIIKSVSQYLQLSISNMLFSTPANHKEKKGERNSCFHSPPTFEVNDDGSI